MATQSHVVWLDECSDEHAQHVGGKAVGLGALVRQDMRVPPGFAISTSAYRAHVEHNGLAEPIERLLASGDADGVRELFYRSAPAPDLVTQVLAAYSSSAATCKPVAVRSSATAEDLVDASFAGQQETYLWLLGGEQVVQHVVRCWASLFTEQAIAYRAHRACPVVDLAMGVVVQQMVPAEAAGVMMTLDPITGDRSSLIYRSGVRARGRGSERRSRSRTASASTRTS